MILSFTFKKSLDFDEKHKRKHLYMKIGCGYVHRLKIMVDNASEEIYRAMNVESYREIPRTKIKLSFHDKKLDIDIYARDTHSLRAAMNSYLRWLNLSIKIEEVIENGS